MGEHLRKVRMDRGLLQREVAAEFGVTASMVMFWETAASGIGLRHLKPVLDFLGYDPRPIGATLGEQMKRKREGMSLSQRELAEKLGVDSSSVGAVEQGRLLERGSRGCFAGSLRPLIPRR